MTTWDVLHARPRHRLGWPSEDVIRFLAAAYAQGHRTMLDLGCGQGRHMKAARELGFHTVGVDMSPVALEAAADHGYVLHAFLHDLLWPDGVFGCAVAAGSFYYGVPADMRANVAELHRVLAPGGTAFVSLKSKRDWRFGKGVEVDGEAFQLVLQGEPEDGMTLTFLSESGVHEMFQAFEGVVVETLEWSQHGQLRLNSDWLVTVTK